MPPLGSPHRGILAVSGNFETLAASSGVSIRPRRGTAVVGLSPFGKPDNVGSMAIRHILLYPDPVLLKPTAPVASVDDGTRELVRDLVETMHHAPGIGLAANQVGVSLRVCVVDLTVGEQPDELHVLINPVVREVAGDQLGEEGCLSFPDITFDVERAMSVTVDTLDLDGRSQTIQAEGLLARAILHECEHLDGQTFLRNLSLLKRDLIKRQIRKRITAGEWAAVAAP